MGVVPSLLEFEHTHGIHVVHEVLLTHPHFDHFAARLAVDVPAAERPPGSAPFTTDLREPGVLGKRP